MFNLLRIVNIVILVLLGVLVAAGANHLRDEAVNQVYSQYAASNTAIVRGYVNSIWAPKSDILIPLFIGDPAALTGNEDVGTFARLTLNYFQTMPIIRANIYGPNYNLLMTVDGALKSAAPISSPTPDMAFVMNYLTNLKNGTPQTIANANEENLNWMQSVFPIRGADGNYEGALEIIVDISEPVKRIERLQYAATGGLLLMLLVLIVLSHVNTKRAETVITKQYEENADLIMKADLARQQNEQKSQFLANISHELRTPLNAIIGFSDVLRSEYVPPEGMMKHRDYINDIHASGAHLLSLINDILDFSKAEAGKLDLEVSEINAVKMVQNCLRLVSPRAVAGNIKLVDALPKTQIIMITDSKRFKQILLNLLSNAVKFTPPEGSVKVSAWMDMQADMCVFEVKDTGIGIAPKDISKAMSPFGQVDSALSRKFDGTGLGLPLTKKFIELMGGKFSIESEVGKGTTITFALPRETKEVEGGGTVKVLA